MRDSHWKPSWGRGQLVRRYLVLDVFTQNPLEGNQLAVFTDGAGLDDSLMQRTARELSLSETIFVLPAEQGGDARLKIFTPLEELPFAGHPVLGAGILLGDLLGQGAVTIETGSGVVPVELEDNGNRAPFGWMTQPLPTWDPFDSPALLEALGVKASALPIEAYTNGPVHVFVNLETEAAVAALEPDFGALRRLRVCVNCFAGAGRRWKSRMFAPALGIDEDPATGSAAGPLAVHLARHGRIEFGEEIEIRQGEEVGRPSLLYARAEGFADAVKQVQVGGSAVVVAHGEYRLR